MLWLEIHKGWQESDLTHMRRLLAAGQGRLCWFLCTPLVGWPTFPRKPPVSRPNTKTATADATSSDVTQQLPLGRMPACFTHGLALTG